MCFKVGDISQSVGYVRKQREASGNCVSLGAGVCVYVCVCQSAGKSALDRTGRCVSGAVCSENDNGQNGEWKSVCLATPLKFCWI